MHTYLDFLTHIKGVEYLLSVLTITGFILFLEILKPKPFRTVIRAGREDLDHLRRTGTRENLRTVGRIFAAPFIGLAYVLALPFICAGAAGIELYRWAAEGFGKLVDLAGMSATFGWRPREAYLGGKKRKKERAKQKTETSEEKDRAS